MSTQILERPDVVPVTQTEFKLEVWHVTCHCYDGKVGWCGSPIKADQQDEPDDAKICPMCELMMEMYPVTCPKGCACTCMERADELWCGVHECDDLEEDDDE